MSDAQPTIDVVNWRNPCAGRFGAVYDFYIEREWLAQLIGRVVWGIDSRKLYRSFSALASVPDGSVVLDVPCGGGVALRALNPAQDIRYLALDLDPKMLSRCAGRAEARGLAQVETERADAENLPVPDRSVDLCLSHGGLHCYQRPDDSLTELVRCLRPGGKLSGSTFVSPGTRRQRRLMGLPQRKRFGLPALWTAQALEDALVASGLHVESVDECTGHVLFEARKPIEAHG